MLSQGNFISHRLTYSLHQIFQSNQSDRNLTNRQCFFGIFSNYLIFLISHLLIVSILFEIFREICFIIASYLSLICLIMASYMRHGWIWWRILDTGIIKKAIFQSFIFLTRSCVAGGSSVCTLDMTTTCSYLQSYNRGHSLSGSSRAKQIHKILHYKAPHWRVSVSRTSNSTPPYSWAGLRFRAPNWSRASVGTMGSWGGLTVNTRAGNEPSWSFAVPGESLQKGILLVRNAN